MRSEYYFLKIFFYTFVQLSIQYTVTMKKKLKSIVSVAAPDFVNGRKKKTNDAERASLLPWLVYWLSTKTTCSVVGRSSSDPDGAIAIRCWKPRRALVFARGGSRTSQSSQQLLRSLNVVRSTQA